MAITISTSYNIRGPFVLKPEWLLISAVLTDSTTNTKGTYNMEHIGISNPRNWLLEFQHIDTISYRRKQVEQTQKIFLSLILWKLISGMSKWLEKLSMLNFFLRFYERKWTVKSERAILGQVWHVFECLWATSTCQMIKTWIDVSNELFT